MKNKAVQTAKTSDLKTLLLFPENNYKLLQEEGIQHYLEEQRQVFQTIPHSHKAK